MKYYLVNETSFQTSFIPVNQPVMQKLCQAWNIPGCRKFTNKNYDWKFTIGTRVVSLIAVRCGLDSASFASQIPQFYLRLGSRGSVPLCEEQYLLEKCGRLLLSRVYLPSSFNFVFKRPRWNSESVGTVRLSAGWEGIEFLSLFLIREKFGLSISFINSFGSFSRS